MIEQIPSPLAATTAPPRKKTGAEDAPQFSYALAAASLEHSAGQSLKTFGGAPLSTTLDDSVPQARKAATGARDHASAQTESPATSQPASDARRDVQGATLNPPQPLAPATIITTASPPAKQSGHAAAPLATIETPVPASARAAQAATGGDAAAKASLEAKPALEAQAAKAKLVPPPTAPKVDDFARLIARRLDEATRFALRLDPPELGRVEGRLVLDDRGDAVLALSFDNQSALDVFARDAAGLRAALTTAGFDLGSGALAFTLRQDQRDPSPLAEHLASPAALADTELRAAFASFLIDLCA